MFKTYSNKKAIEKLEKQISKAKDDFTVSMLKDKLSKEKLFEEYSILRHPRNHDGFKHILFNDKNGIVRILDDTGYFDINYADIHKSELVEEYQQQDFTTTTTKNKGGVGRAVVGGALFGGVGAIVGAATSGSKSYSTTTGGKTLTGYRLNIFKENNEFLVGIGIPYVGGFFNKKPIQGCEELCFKFKQILELNSEK